MLESPLSKAVCVSALTATVKVLNNSPRGVGGCTVFLQIPTKGQTSAVRLQDLCIVPASYSDDCRTLARALHSLCNTLAKGSGGRRAPTRRKC